MGRGRADDKLAGGRGVVRADQREAPTGWAESAGAQHSEVPVGW
jgi:hypothetical protein